VAGNCAKANLKTIWFSQRAQDIRDSYKNRFRTVHSSGLCCPFLVKNETVRQALAAVRNS